MSALKTTQFSVATVLLFIGLAAVVNTALRVDVGKNWDENRCDPYVVPIAGFFKPTGDKRTMSEFSRDNWQFCQKKYVEGAIREIVEAPKQLAAAQSGTVGIIDDVASGLSDVFVNVWQFCYEAYSGFMSQIGHAAKLLQNFFIRFHYMMGQLQAAALSIVYGLISMIILYVDVTKVVIIVTIIITGILVGLEIILFYILAPISGLIALTVSLVSVVAVVVATAVAAAFVAELFTPGACFAAGTRVLMGGSTNSDKLIEEIHVGDVLRDGGVVTATHLFWSPDALYDIDGIHVTGDHLVTHPDRPRQLISASRHPAAQPVPARLLERFQGGKWLYCLTTTTRRIPCRGTGGAMIFADWEEIQEEDQERLEDWHREVWHRLNGAAYPVGRIDRRILEAEAGLAPDCLVACQSWSGRQIWKRISEVEVGERVFDRMGHTTTVVGRVVIAGDQATDAIKVRSPEHRSQLVSPATWIQRTSGTWAPALAGSEPGDIVGLHPHTWHHLYTESGEFMISGGWKVRDASEVGLVGLRSLVHSVVLAENDRQS